MTTWQKVIGAEIVILACLVGAVVGFLSFDATNVSAFDSPIAGMMEPCAYPSDELRVFLPSVRVGGSER